MRPKFQRDTFVKHSIPIASLSNRMVNFVLRFHRSTVWMQLLDIALIGTIVLLAFSEIKIFAFHLIFFLLTFGAFYWPFSAFVLRVAVMVTLTSAMLILFVWIDVVPMEELVEIPMLSAILFIVFSIAGQRAKAESALQEANEALETRVLERTAALRKEVADRLCTEQILRESEDRYRRLIELSFEAVIIHNAAHRLLYMNPAGVNLVGATDAHELHGRSIQELIHPDSWPTMTVRFQELQPDVKGVPLVEEQLLRVDGSAVDVEMVTISIVYQGLPAMQTVIRDISARKQAEEVRTAERMTIARDLHDSLAQNLSFLRLKLDELAEAPRSSDQEPPTLFVQLRNVADESYRQVRTTIAALMPVNTTPFMNAVRAQANLISQQAHFVVHLYHRGKEGTLSPIVQQQALSVCREALHNIAKHADAQTVEIGVWWEAARVTIRIIDDGNGFDPDRPLSTNSFGLRIMQERATQMGGILTVESSLESGTTVTLQIPLR